MKTKIILCVCGKRAFCFAKILLFLLVFVFTRSQAQRLILGAVPTYVNISGGTVANPIYLNIGNSAANAIQRTSGWIISEGQYNYVNWQGCVASTSYTIPFGYSITDYLPFTFNRNATGLASNLIVSTWGTSTFLKDNMPYAGATNVAAVTNMNLPSGSAGAVCCAIDRWWTINTTATATLSFTYRGAENTMINSGDAIGIQHWTGTCWNDGNNSPCSVVSYTHTGSTGLTVGDNTVTGTTTCSQFSPYILVDASSPLPIELLTFNAVCNNTKMVISWSTASEINNDYFSLERSIDGITWSTIAIVPGAGNSNTMLSYSYTDDNPFSGTSYCRLKQTDYNGQSETFVPVAVNCLNDGSNIIAYGVGNDIFVDINGVDGKSVTIELYNILGQKVMTEIKNISAGLNQFKISTNIKSAVYVVKIYNNDSVISKKVFLK